MKPETPALEKAPSPIVAYFRITRGAWYGFLFALPILLGYEALEFIFRPPYLNGADALIRVVLQALGSHGRAGTMLVLILVCGLLCWLFDGSRKTAQGVGRRSRYFVGMLIESFVYALFLGVVVSRLMQLLTQGWTLQLNPTPNDPLFQFTMSLGAGIYEELVFRVLLMGGLILLLHKGLKIDRPLAWVIAVAVSSVIFSTFHFRPIGMDPFSLDSFLYRAIAGGVLATIYATRGFGVAVWTHALYDLLVMFLH